MEQILKAHEKLEKKSNLGKAIDHVEGIIEKLKQARGDIAEDPKIAPITLAKLQTPVKQSFDKVNEDLTEIYKGLNAYSKAIEKKFEKKTLPFTDDNNALSNQPSLVNRAIAMHLLREGHFDVATSFISEVNNSQSSTGPSTCVDTFSAHSSVFSDHLPPPQPTTAIKDAWEADFAPSADKSTDLQQKFAEMYHILHELRNRGNLTPAIEWARQNSTRLEARGSTLEYDLCRLQYISLFTSPTAGPLSAILYARQTFPRFPPRYAAQTQALVGALAFTSNLAKSPYAHLFSSSLTSTPTGTADPTTAAATAFTSDFCALLSLSSASPLLTAVTAGCIALPTLVKFSQIQANVRTSWTTAGELPFEVQLPPAFSFHSVFVCPVSKEQSTDANPPMMMPCGHVVAKESMEKLSRGTRFKCPYCPAESHPKDAMMVFL